MRRIIHHIRNQPAELRRHLLHVIVVVFAVILLSAWVYSLGTNFSAEVTEEAKEGFAPFSALKGNILDGYKSMSEPGLQVDQ